MGGGGVGGGGGGGVGEVVITTRRERKPNAATTWATVSDLQQGMFYMHHPIDRIAHTTAFVTPVVEHWLEQEIDGATSPSPLA